LANPSLFEQFISPPTPFFAAGKPIMNKRGKTYNPEI